MDILMIGLAVLLCLLTLGATFGCKRLQERRSS